MISLKKISVALISSLILISCSNDEINDTNTSINELPKDVLKKLEDLQLSPKNFELKEFVYPDGNIEEIIITSGDMAMKKNRFLNIPAGTEGISKQYRTQFIVDINIHEEVNINAYIGDTIFIDGLPRIAGLTEGAQQGIKDAVENWNSVFGSKLKLRVDFDSSLVFDEDFYEIAIANDLSLPGFGGFADFPDENGNPGAFVAIGSDANNFAAQFPDAIEHLVTHELGHTIGFRHTDWNTRQTCVDFGLEPEPSEEPNPPALIFGTLPSIPGVIEQSNSIMNACFGVRAVTGELNVFDKNGLRSLYPGFSFY
ncbi:M57 family metalloprotease [uncultured Aquimarina sp.]|uniref:M57 family metalloprotease n=1 Tax=uncultured Aquimarina sp. TaxID=575652 RepID=UPI002612C006|nr:M57 family metalloprotease [uncultured Aquimarina sp.]